MIHPTAIIEDGAIIGQNVSVGPFSYIGKNVTLEENVKVYAHVIIDGYTSIGTNTIIFPNAIIGMPPQDIKFKDEITYVLIGKDCIIRENVTIHSGTKQSKSVTKIGNNCFLMVDSHVAHDCEIGDNVILINQATLAGHTTVGDYAIIGGLSALHQHVRIGKHAFIAGMTGVEQDILPYGLGKGILRRCYLTGVNITGLKRRNFSKESIFLIQKVYKLIFDGPSSEIVDRARSLSIEYKDISEINDLIQFILEKPNRHICHPNDKSIIK
jgi:UDP-N-acetylglucosamine acyltransferase